MRESTSLLWAYTGLSSAKQDKGNYASQDAGLHGYVALQRGLVITAQFWFTQGVNPVRHFLGESSKAARTEVH